MCKRNSQSSEEWDNKPWKPKRSIRGKFIYIAILIALILPIYNLRPRTYSAKWNIKDVVRRHDLHQIETAISNYKDINWVWPNLDNAENWTTVSSMKKELKKLWVSRKQFRDPKKETEVYWLWIARENWEYLYIVTKKDWVKNWWFVLMAKTEVEWWTNWIVCKDGSWLEQWYITNDTDINDIKLCDKRVDKSDICSPADCKYKNFNEELRYIVIH